MLNKRPFTPVDLVLIACLFTLMAVALYTVPTAHSPSSQEVSTDD
ncbi:hypothetical protein [Stenomitos frigidus]|nr:hypothetical protein [Stenomitos frigidus]